MNKRSLAIGFFIGYGLNYLLHGLGLMGTPDARYQIVVGGVSLIVALVAVWNFTFRNRGD